MQKNVCYQNRALPYFLVLPQVIITAVFFLWPAFYALKAAFFRGDAFGIQSHFVGFANFSELFTNKNYLASFGVTLLFGFLVAFIALSSALLMALLVSKLTRSRALYKSFLIWPYAVAPAIAGILWRFLFDPAMGIIAYLLQQSGVAWNFALNGKQALFLVVLASAWQQFSYNFIFFLAGLLAIPASLLEASSIDGAGSWRTFWTIIFPMLSPTTFFLLMINLIYALFGTFGVVQTVTEGGPHDATNILVYKVYYDGFFGLDLGGSSAQSVILMVFVILLTLIQFRYIERKVHY